MNKEDKSILIAMSLGDGYICKNGQLQLEHSANQLEYVEWKHTHLLRICGGKRNKLYFRERLDSRTNKVYKQVSANKQHKYFRIIRKWLHKPKKTYSNYLLSKLTPLGLAIWYMDDGNLSVYRSKKTGKISSIQVCLYTMCDKEQNDLVKDFFLENFGIEFKTYQIKPKEMYYLCANTKNGNKFLDLVRTHVIPSMNYKVDVNSKSA